MNDTATIDHETPATDAAISATVTIDVRVADRRALHAAAFAAYGRANALRSGADLAGEFEEMYGTPEAPDVPNLTRLLFDTGEDVPGVQVQDSHAEIHAAPGGDRDDERTGLQRCADDGRRTVDDHAKRMRYVLEWPSHGLEMTLVDLIAYARSEGFDFDALVAQARETLADVTTGDARP